jgi:DNA-binding response OmpR family regulator
MTAGMETIVVQRIKRALIIEDEESWVDLLGMLLHESDFHVMTTSSIKEGLKIAKAEKLDLLVVDLDLPDGHGMDLLKTVSELPGKEDLPVIVLSAYHREEVGDLDFGKAHFVSKDQGLPPLLQSLKTLNGRITD